MKDFMAFFTTSPIFKYNLVLIPDGESGEKTSSEYYCSCGALIGEKFEGARCPVCGTKNEKHEQEKEGIKPVITPTISLKDLHKICDFFIKAKTEGDKFVLDNGVTFELVYANYADISVLTVKINDYVMDPDKFAIYKDMGFFARFGQCNSKHRRPIIERVVRKYIGD